MTMMQDVQPARPADGCSNWRLLIVDDDPLALSITSTIASLAVPGIRIESVDDPAMAIDLCGKVRFDCVLVDYEMPGLNGIELALAIRSHDAYVPILLCSGVGNETLVADAMKMGVSDYLPKACISVDLLRDAIGQAIAAATAARTMAVQNQDLQMFAFALAHEFKQPLRQIMTLADMARAEATSGSADPGKLGQYLEFLASAAARLDRTVGTLSDYSVLAISPELAPVDLSAILGELIVQDEIAGASGGAVTLEGDCLAALGDEALLEQIFTNLIANGLKYNTSDQPHVTITLADRPGHVEVRVSDNGIGIDERYLDYIFQPLTRLHTRERYPGSGIGLSLAQKAAMAMNGAIRCESRPGKGSVFILTLQSAQGDTPPADARRAPDMTEGGTR